MNSSALRWISFSPFISHFQFFFYFSCSNRIHISNVTLSLTQSQPFTKNFISCQRHLKSLHRLRSEAWMEIEATINIPIWNNNNIIQWNRNMLSDKWWNIPRTKQKKRKSIEEMYLICGCKHTWHKDYKLERPFFRYCLPFVKRKGIDCRMKTDYIFWSFLLSMIPIDMCVCVCEQSNYLFLILFVVFVFNCWFIFPSVPSM